MRVHTASCPGASMRPRHWASPGVCLEIAGDTWRFCAYCEWGTTSAAASRSSHAGAWMQHVNRPADVQAFPEPARACRPRVDMKTLRVVRRAKRLHGLRRHRERRWHLGHQPPIRSPELQRAIRAAGDRVSLLVHRPMMPTTQGCEVRECRLPPSAPTLRFPEKTTAEVLTVDARRRRHGITLRMRSLAA